MKFILLLLILIIPLSATPSGHIYHLDKFFGQTDTHYAVLRYTYENKGSYYYSTEKAELLEFLKKGKKIVTTTLVYSGGISTNVDNYKEVTRSMTSNPQANIAEKMVLYKTFHATQPVMIEANFTIWNDILRLDDGTVLLHGKDLTSIIAYEIQDNARNPLEMPHLSLFSVDDEFYIRSNPFFEDQESYAGGFIIYLGKEMSMQLRDRDQKKELYLTCETFTSLKEAQAFVKSHSSVKNFKDEVSIKFEIWRASRDQYVVVYKDSTKLILAKKIPQIEKELKLKLTPIFSTSFEFLCKIKE